MLTVPTLILFSFSFISFCMNLNQDQSWLSNILSRAELNAILTILRPHQDFAEMLLQHQPWINNRFSRSSCKCRYVVQLTGSVINCSSLISSTVWDLLIVFIYFELLDGPFAELKYDDCVFAHGC